MANLVLDLVSKLDLKRHFVLFDDFWADQSDTFWIDTPTDGGSATVGDAENGVMAITTTNDNTDNDEVYLESPNEVFLVESGRSLLFRACIQFTEANTDDANVAAGFASAVAADLIVDDGAGMRTSGNYFVIYKVDGGTVWIAECRNGSTKYANTSGITAGGASYQELEIEVGDFDGTNVRVTYKVNGNLLNDSTSGDPIVHYLPVSGSTEMAAFFGLKNGGGADETLNVDWVYAAQTRNNGL